MKIEDIKIGDRFRKDLGDLQTLAKSIQEIGLLQPIVVNQDNELIVGQRRLEACKILGQTEVSTTIVNLDDIIKGEYHENAVRKNFTTSERVAVLEEIETRRIGHKPAKGDNLAPFQNQHKGEKSREIVARYTGISPALLQKEKKNVDAARNDPNRFGQLLEKVDSGKWAINKAYKKLQNEQRRKALVETAKENKELPENVSISCGDFVIESKKLTDNSIDLIFVDPLYFRKDLPSYERLASVASRVLKPGGSIIFNVGHGIIPEVISSF